MKIRKGKPSDLREIHYLLNSVKELRDFEKGEEYPIRWVRNLLENNKDNIVLVCESEDKEMIGFLISLLLCGVKEAILNNLYVKESYRKGGIAGKMVEEYEKELKRRKFTFSIALAGTDNKIVQKFNEKHGYDRGKKFYFYYKWLK